VNEQESLKLQVKSSAVLEWYCPVRQSF